MFLGNAYLVISECKIYRFQNEGTTRATGPTLHELSLDYDSVDDCITVCVATAHCGAVNYGSSNNVTFRCELFDTQSDPNLVSADNYKFYKSLGKCRKLLEVFI